MKLRRTTNVHFCLCLPWIAGLLLHSEVTESCLCYTFSIRPFYVLSINTLTVIMLVSTATEEEETNTVKQRQSLQGRVHGGYNCISDVFSSQRYCLLNLMCAACFFVCLPLSSQPTSSMRSVQALRQTTGMIRMYWATMGGSKRFVFVLSLSVLPMKTCSTETWWSKTCRLKRGCFLGDLLFEMI